MTDFKHAVFDTQLRIQAVAQTPDARIGFTGLVSLIIILLASGANASSVDWINAGTSATDSNQFITRSLGATATQSDRGFAARFGRWMDTRISASLRAYTLSGTAGDGEDSYLQFSHSRTDTVDESMWNPDANLSNSTEFSATRRTGKLWWHALGAHTPGESQYHLGTSVGRLGFSVGSGRGHTMMKLSGSMNDVNPWLFHGGRRLPFEFSGATASLDIGRFSAIELGNWSYQMQGLDARRTRFVGLRGARAYARFYDVSSSASDGLATGLELGWQSSRYALGFREIRSNFGASTRTLRFSTDALRKARVSLSLQKDHNPQFDAVNDTRVMLSFSGRFGHGNRWIFNADEAKNDPEMTEEEAAKAKSRRGRNIALIGGGAVLVGAMAGGGGGSDGPSASGARYNSERGAGYAVLNGVNPQCVRENREYGGWVFRNADGSYGHINPIQGDLDSVNIGSPLNVPEGTIASASYHCHGGPDPRYDNENFSPQDLRADRYFGVNGYLSTPGGKFKFHNVRTDQISTLGTVRVQ